MSDTIDRQAAIDVMCAACWDWCDEGVCKRVSALQQLPPTQHEIIRCKDCKHAKITADGKYMKYCSQWDVDDALYLDSGFFCGHAERRTDEHSG